MNAEQKSKRLWLSVEGGHVRIHIAQSVMSMFRACRHELRRVAGQQLRRDFPVADGPHVVEEYHHNADLLPAPKRAFLRSLADELSGAIEAQSKKR